MSSRYPCTSIEILFKDIQKQITVNTSEFKLAMRNFRPKDPKTAKNYINVLQKFKCLS